MPVTTAKNKKNTAKRNKVTADRRREVVEAQIRKSGWSEDVCQNLMKLTGASRSTLYRDKDDVAKLLAQEETAGLHERRALFLVDLRRLRADAAREKDFSPAARLIDLECRILGLDRVPLPEVEEVKDTADSVDTSLEGLLVTVRKMRRQAQAGHSYVAADKLLEREYSIVTDIRKREEAKNAAELAHLSEEALVDQVLQVIVGLPAKLKARLREAIGPP